VQLQAAEAAGARFKLIVTDGVFSMDWHHRRPGGDLRTGGPSRRPW